MENLLCEAEFIITVADFSVEWWSQRFSNYAHKIHRVYNGVFPEQFVRKKTRLHPPRILSIGRYVKDNLPTVITEAMAASVPVVAMALAGVPEMVIHGETGYLVPEGDYNAAVFAIETLLRAIPLVKKTGERGRLLALEKLDIAETTSSLKSLLVPTVRSRADASPRNA